MKIVNKTRDLVIDDGNICVIRVDNNADGEGNIIDRYVILCNTKTDSRTWILLSKYITRHEALKDLDLYTKARGKIFIFGK